MREEKFFSIQEVQTGDMAFIQSGKETEIKDRELDTSYDGIVADGFGNVTPFLITLNGDNTINVGPGQAYDLDGNRVEVFSQARLNQVYTITTAASDEIINWNTPIAPGTGGKTYRFAKTVSRVSHVTPITDETPIRTGNISVKLLNTTVTGAVVDVASVGTSIDVYILYMQQINLSDTVITDPIPEYFTATGSFSGVEGGLTDDSTTSGDAALYRAINQETLDTHYPQKIDGYIIFTVPSASSTTESDPDGFTRRIFDASTLFNVPSTVRVGNQAKPIFLGTVVSNPGGFPSGLDYTGRKFYLRRASTLGTRIPAAPGTVAYAGGTSVTVQDHIGAIGSGSVGPNNPHGLAPSDIGVVSTGDLERHRYGQHTSGFFSASPTSTAQALFPTISPAVNPTILTLQKLLDTGSINVRDVIYSGGVLIDRAIMDGVNPVTPQQLVDIVSAASTFTFTFSAPTPASNGTYVIYVDNAGVLRLAPFTGLSGGTVTDVAAVENLISTAITNLGNRWLPVCRVSWNGTTLFDFVDLRKFGSVSNFDLENAAVTADKLDFETQHVNTAVINFSFATTINLVDHNSSSSSTVGKIGYTMDGFYSKWLGGYVRQGTNDVKSKVDGKVKFNITGGVPGPVPTAFFLNSGSFIDIATANSASSSLDTGRARPNNWYSVFAVEKGTTPVNNGFRLVFTTMIRVQSYSSGQTIKVSHHARDTGGPSYFNTSVDYSWTADAYKGSQVLVLTGSLKGKIFDVVSNSTTAGDDASTTSTLVINSAQSLSGLAKNDYLMLSPAQTAGNPGLYAGADAIKPNNFRYLGTIYTEGATINPNPVIGADSGVGFGTFIRGFQRHGNKYVFSSNSSASSGYIVVPTVRISTGATGGVVVGPINLTGIEQLSGFFYSLCPPTATAISGFFGVQGASSSFHVVSNPANQTTGVTGEGARFVVSAMRVAQNGTTANTLVTVPYDDLLLAIPQTVWIMSSSVVTNGFLYVNGWSE